MEIISITRKPSSANVPDTFIVGQVPTKGDVVFEGPVVSKIKYFGMSTVYDKAYRGAVYVVEFENATVKRVIPAENNVIDVAVETVKRQEIKIPEPPE